MFEYKRLMIDKRLEEEKKLNEETSRLEKSKDEKPEIIVQKKVNENVIMDRKKPPPVEFKFVSKPKNNKEDIQVKINFKKDEIIPSPKLVKDEQGYRLESQNTVYQNIYLSRDEDDPVIVKPTEYVSVDKKIRKEDKLEEQCCHGETMDDSQINDKSEMLEGDKSLKNYLEIDEENSERTSCKVTFQENREKVEEFYKTNIETLLENRNKLAGARER
jgi:hypothetical protein